MWRHGFVLRFLRDKNKLLFEVLSWLTILL